MTDNDQASPNGDTLFLAQNIINQIADLYAERIPSDDWVPVRQDTNDWLDEWVSGLIAKHRPDARVALVMDGRNILANWFLDRGAGLPAGPAIADALLASGLVQVTTPTETDDGLLRFADWLEENGYGPTLANEARNQSAALASRPAPVAPPTEEWTDPQPFEHYSTRRRRSYSGGGYLHHPRTREQYEADQQPVVPVALTRGLTHKQIASRPAPVAPPTEESKYQCSQAPHQGREFYGDGGCGECGYVPAEYRVLDDLIEPDASDPVASLVEDIARICDETDTETNEATQAWVVGNIRAALFRFNTREECEADQQPVVPVDALGFPTQEGATFTAFFSNVQLRMRHTFKVVKKGVLHACVPGTFTLVETAQLDHTSIEDVRPADRRNGQ